VSSMGILWSIIEALAEFVGGTVEVSYPHDSKKHGPEHIDISIRDSRGKVIAKEHVPSPCQPDFDGPEKS
jgi:hypothetical protein